MRVETSLAEMLLNAIAQGRIWRVQFSRKHGSDPGDERRTFDDLNKVIERRIDSALQVAREQGYREMRELRAENAALKAERDKLHAALAELAKNPEDLLDCAHDGTGPSIAAALVRLHERATREEE